VVDSRVCGTDTELVYSEKVSLDIENIINMNLNQPLSLVALFISRLLKGLQNLTNCKDDWGGSWGFKTFSIEDIGTVFFLPIYDPETGDYALYINDIQWAFKSSKFFEAFTVA